MNLFKSKSAAPGAEQIARDLASATDDLLRYARPQAARVAELAAALARELGIGEADRQALDLAAHARDAGLILMPRDYLRRAGELTVEERSDLARHPVVGEGEAARSGLDRRVQLLVRWHHEDFDGGGYPDALAGDHIPLPARILRAADAACALLAARPWRDALAPDKVLTTLRAGAGLEFDPFVIHTFGRRAARDALASFISPSVASASESAAPPSEATTHATTFANDPSATTHAEASESIGAAPIEHASAEHVPVERL